MSDPTLYQDYTIHVVHPQFIGHVTWEGRTSGTPAYALPINLTLTNTSTNVVYTFSTTTDTSGNFSVDANALPAGNYNWHVKGTQYLSSSGGSVAFTPMAVPPTVEMGLQRAGDANNDNLVDITDFGILYGTFGNYTDPRADFNGDQVVDITDFSLLRGNFGQLGNRPGMAPPKQTGGSAVLEVRPQGKAPSNGGTVHVGDRFTLELWVNAQPGTNVVAQQSYLSFPPSELQLGDSKMANPVGGGPTLVTPDGNVLDVTLQNGICDGPNACSFNGLTVPAGSLAFASGTLNGTPGTGAFRVGTVTVQATAPGTATLHWQFSPPDPSTRNTKIVSDSGETVSQPGQFVDYVLNILPTGK